MRRNIFPGGKSPFKHAIYVIRENRTYDQVFGESSQSGDGNKADGDRRGDIWCRRGRKESERGSPQDITPNAHALAMRFRLIRPIFC